MPLCSVIVVGPISSLKGKKSTVYKIWSHLFPCHSLEIKHRSFFFSFSLCLFVNSPFCFVFLSFLQAWGTKHASFSLSSPLSLPRSESMTWKDRRVPGNWRGWPFGPDYLNALLFHPTRATSSNQPPLPQTHTPPHQPLSLTLFP